MLGYLVTSAQHRRRFVQLIATYFFASLAGATFAGTHAKLILLVSALVMVFIYRQVRSRQNIETAITCFLWLITLQISALVANNNVIYNPLVICYALVVLYAALFSSRTIFISLAIFISLYCSALLAAVIEGYWPAPNPKVALTSIVAINLYILIASLTAWVIAKDFKAAVTDLRQENKQSEQARLELKIHATQDPLTGLSNRSNAEQAFNKLAVTEANLAVVFIDLDNFKPINDAYGHATGDIALQIIAKRIANLLTPGEICCRFGGDEFVLILNDSDPTLCKTRYQLFLDTIAEDINIELRTFKLSASIGVAYFPAHSADFNELCRFADQAMYRAKAAGKNSAALYRPEWQDQQRKKLDMKQALRFAIEKNELFLEYQPKYHLATLQINGVEALVRWQSKEFGLISPAAFIPLAEETGLIDQIGLFVLKQACADCKSWLQQGFDISVSVNLSPAQLNSGLLPEQVLSILAETQLAPHYLELEITESMLMQDQNSIDSQINSLSDQGIGFAIDDFGTGYSNLHYLSRFKAATLKIDQSFIRKLNKSSQSFNLVKGIVVLAKTLGLSTVAEGVEDQKTLHILSSLDCDSVQGYLLSKPVSIAGLFLQLNNEKCG